MLFAHNPAETAPDLGRADRLRFLEVKSKADPVEIDRTIQARLIMARRAKVVADAGWAKLHILRARRGAKTFELQMSSPELCNCHARFGYERIPIHRYGEAALKAALGFICCGRKPGETTKWLWRQIDRQKHFPRRATGR
jgi:hypothetical protein